MMKIFSIFIFSLLTINYFSQPYSKSWLDLDYAGDSMPYHRLDIMLPEVQKPAYRLRLLFKALQRVNVQSQFVLVPTDDTGQVCSPINILK